MSCFDSFQDTSVSISTLCMHYESILRKKHLPWALIMILIFESTDFNDFWLRKSGLCNQCPESVQLFREFSAFNMNQSSPCRTTCRVDDVTTFYCVGPFYKSYASHGPKALIEGPLPPACSPLRLQDSDTSSKSKAIMQRLLMKGFHLQIKEPVKQIELRNMCTHWSLDSWSLSSIRQESQSVCNH